MTASSNSFAPGIVLPLSYEGDGTLVDAAGTVACQVDHHREMDDGRVEQIAAFILQAVNAAGQRPGEMERIDRSSYPEIIQAARWSDADNGTNNFVPGVGFVVDDPDGLMIPARWVPHLPTIEAALSGLDHVNPHPLDVDTIDYLKREGKNASLQDSAAYCFVCGEHTPMTALQRSSEGLWVASRFLYEYFEGWDFNPTSGWEFAAAEERGE